MFTWSALPIDAYASYASLCYANGYAFVDTGYAYGYVMDSLLTKT